MYLVLTPEQVEHARELGIPVDRYEIFTPDEIKMPTYSKPKKNGWYRKFEKKKR